MSAAAESIAMQLAQSRSKPRGWKPNLARFEDLLIAAILFAMVAIPLAESVLRRTLHTGIVGATSIVQHFVLLVGMLGGAIAAREGRLLALSTLADTRLHGKWKRVSRIFTASLSVVVTVYLLIASWQYLVTEREAAKILAYGIPVWTIELALPVGFGIIALRLLLQAGASWWIRGITAIASAFMILAVAYWPFHAWSPVVVILALLTLATVLGIPAYATIGGIALTLFWGMSQPIAAIPIAHYSLVTNPALPTLPLFTLAGFFLAEGGTPQRLVRLFYALFGRFRGGPAMVTVLVCAFFTSFTGASGVTILALGGLLMPILTRAEYSEKNALGLVTGAGSLGLLLPPCLPLILYAIVARVPINQMFLAGILPALVMMAATAIWGVRNGAQTTSDAPAWSAREATQALWHAKWELLMPVVASVALFGGFATPVEAAAITALYAFIVVAVIHRELNIFEDVPRVMSHCGLLIGGVLLILGVALGFTDYLVDAEVPLRAVAWTTQHVHSPLVFLLLLNLFLLIAGCLMEIYPAIIVEVPLLVPLGAAFGIDPLRLGIIFLANMELGYLTPPVGLNLLMSSYRFGKPVPEVLRSVLPVVAVLAIGVLLITYVPFLTTALPRWFGQ
jgi:C4-dicarboxylate transporter, DctM subunit